jgi:hypothetical protein
MKINIIILKIRDSNLLYSDSTIIQIYAMLGIPISYRQGVRRG